MTCRHYELRELDYDRTDSVEAIALQKYCRRTKLLRVACPERDCICIALVPVHFPMRQVVRPP
jgi:hypothetical protein